ncbi:CgeB family protein [Chengkuizengella marina]|nr:glycosyltransferase [Chengkuizengella marina]
MNFSKQNTNILFVRSGLGNPYDILETSIIHHFKKEIQYFHSILPDQNLLNVAKTFQPNLIIFFSGFNVSTNDLTTLKEMGYYTAVWLLDDPYITDITQAMAPIYDFVFTVEKGCIEFYKSLGCQNVHFLPLAVDPDIFHFKNELDIKYQTDVLFIGNAHPDRLLFFNTIEHELVKRNMKIIGPNWDKLGNFRLRENILVNNWVSAEETSKYYNGAKIVINMHRSVNNPEINQNHIRIKAISMNARTFEIAACGAFQLTDVREELINVYIPGDDIATYTTPNDLLEKIDYYLLHEDERRRMASNAIKKTLQTETYTERIKQLLDIVN